jgi:hypothetical protein
MTNRTFFLILVFLYLSSCETKQSSERKLPSTSQGKKTIDTLLNKDLTRAKEFYQHFIIQSSQHLDNEIIDTLNYQFDSLQIRLWLSGGLFYQRQLYIIKRQNASWTGIYYELKAENRYVTGDSTLDYLHGPIPFEVSKKKIVKPKMGWTKFVDTLISLNIKTLPDMNEVPSMKTTRTDSRSGSIEFSSKGDFRFYSYFDSHMLADRFWQARNFEEISYLFYNQLLR